MLSKGRKDPDVFLWSDGMQREVSRFEVQKTLGEVFSLLCRGLSMSRAKLHHAQYSQARHDILDVTSFIVLNIRFK